MARSLSEYFSQHLPEVEGLPDEILRANFEALEEVRLERARCCFCRKPQCPYHYVYKITVSDENGNSELKIETEMDKCEHLEAKTILAKKDKYFASCRLGKRFIDRRFDNFITEEYNTEALHVCYNYVASIKERLQDGKGLLLMGPVGTGKTHLVASMIHEAIEKHVVLAVFVTVPELLARIRASFEKGNQETQGELFELVRSADLLVLDDIGAEKTSEWVREQLYIIINSRYDDLKPVVITSNCTAEELEERIGERATSRIIEMCDWVVVDGPDYRKKKLE